MFLFLKFSGGRRLLSEDDNIYDGLENNGKQFNDTFK